MEVEVQDAENFTQPYFSAFFLPTRGIPSLALISVLSSAAVSGTRLVSLPCTTPTTQPRRHRVLPPNARSHLAQGLALALMLLTSSSTLPPVAY